MSAVQSLLAFLFALGVLVTVHEFGHYWVARRAGVRILRFSVGFGRPLWSRRVGPDQTEFVVAAVPLGGYVKMLDEREGEVAVHERHRTFNRQPLGVRAAIVVAGPLANLLLAVVAFWLMFMVGVTGLKPVIGEVTPGSLAARAGLEPNMEVLAIDGSTTPTWESVLHRSIETVIDQGVMTLRVRDAGGAERDIRIDLGALEVDDLSRGEFWDKLGARPQRLHVPPVVGEVIAGGAAERDGMRSGDHIVSVGGQSIEDWEQWVALVRDHPGRRMDVLLLRDGQSLRITLTPSVEETADGTIGRIGLGPDTSGIDPSGLAAVERYPMLPALAKAWTKTFEMSAMTLKVMGKMVIGEASVANLSGPISIAQFAGQSASIGIAAFLGFLAVVSVSLGVLNLLPIPLLDGGHLLYYFVEFLTRRPVSETVQTYGQQVGIAVLMGLMGIACYNDIVRSGLVQQLISRLL